jgi:hypothetical protein
VTKAMSSTDAREQAGEPAVPEQAGLGGAAESARLGVAARRGGHAAGHGATGGDAPGGGLAVTGYRRRRRAWVLALAVIVVAAAGVGGADAAGVFRAAKPAASIGAYATGTVAVTRGPLTEQAQETGTVGDSGSYTVVVPGSSGGSGPSSGSGASTFTWLPQVGQAIRQGQQIYQVSGTTVVLLYGNVPAYRDLAEGMTGADVTELNTDLVELGYATAAALGPRSGWDYFSSQTAYALGLLQAHLGLTVTGSLPLGQAVFLPGAVQVTSLGSGAVPGGTATAGATVLTGSSLSPVVTVDLDASLQSEVAVGDKVSVTLPDNTTTPGVISQITTAPPSSSPATGSGDTGSDNNGSGSGNDASGNSGSGTATITVVVSLANPKAAGSLSQAPVEVTITTGSVSNALIVPVDALLAQPGGRYAVEVTSPGRHHLVKVTPGLFDDAAGTVQVTGNLTPGQRVVVPGT